MDMPTRAGTTSAKGDAYSHAGPRIASEFGKKEQDDDWTSS
jgi:hypothetical protein